MNHRQIIALSPSERLELHTRAVAGGDTEAARDFVLSSVWRSIRRARHIKAKEKVPTFAGVCRAVGVVLQQA